MFEDYGAIVEKIDDAKKASGKEPPRSSHRASTALEAYIDEVDMAKKAGKDPPNVALTTLESDLVTLLRGEGGQAGRGEARGEPDQAQEVVGHARAGRTTRRTRSRSSTPGSYGAKTALLYTAVVPAVLAVGFLLLILYFAATGGYKQVHLEDETHPPMGEY